MVVRIDDTATFAPATNRAVITLADIEAFDPSPTTSAGRRRFACRLCRSAGQHLVVDDSTGRWRCWRCQAYGIVRERWHTPGETAALSLAVAFGRATDAATAASRLAERRKAATAPSPPKDDSWWRRHWESSLPLGGTPGEIYLAGRGIPLEVAELHGVRYGRRFLQPRECLLFPFTDRERKVVALNARYLDGQATKTQSAGPRSHGAFWSPGALDRDPVVVVEGPIDALSLFAAGVPALALVGTAGTTWLPEACAGKTVAVALDNDQQGDAASVRLAAQIAAAGGRPHRCRPHLNDWGDMLMSVGAEALAGYFGTVPYAAPAPTPLVSAPVHCRCGGQLVDDSAERCPPCEDAWQILASVDILGDRVVCPGCQDLVDDLVNVGAALPVCEDCAALV